MKISLLWRQRSSSYAIDTHGWMKSYQGQAQWDLWFFLFWKALSHRDLNQKQSIHRFFFSNFEGLLGCFFGSDHSPVHNAITWAITQRPTSNCCHMGGKSE